MRSSTAVIDACLLYQSPLRDLIMHLTLADLFRARWTDRIHDEWIRNVLRDRPDLTAGRLQRTRELMDANARDCLVTGYEPLIDALQLPDPNDRHVLAAAIRCSADTIVTYNLKDFPTAALAPYDIRAQHPDDFVVDLIAYDARRVCAAIRRQREQLRNPPRRPLEFLDSLERLGLPLAAADLRRYTDIL